MGTQLKLGTIGQRHNHDAALVLHRSGEDSGLFPGVWVKEGDGAFEPAAITLTHRLPVELRRVQRGVHVGEAFAGLKLMEPSITTSSVWPLVVLAPFSTLNSDSGVT
ncbi:hypothetical protein EFB08_23220 [Rufibacter latericius]|uniref:Uncharacterized protein n=1 Tax=Rufibacter latericius TaxID=2487040 RepID=A0A3M9M977_9BACT|nr:hypothetical protein EFB08_23220 [Rufibacter latericius]